MGAFFKTGSSCCASSKSILNPNSYDGIQLNFHRNWSSLLIVDSFVCRSGPTGKAQSLVNRMLSVLPGIVSTRIKNQHGDATLGAGRTVLPAVPPSCSALTPGTHQGFPRALLGHTATPRGQMGQQEKNCGFSATSLGNL